MNGPCTRLGVTAYYRCGAMGRFLGQLLEFPRLALEVCGFACESCPQFRDFPTRLLKCLLPFARIAEHRLQFRSQFPPLLAKGL